MTRSLESKGISLINIMIIISILVILTAIAIPGFMRSHHHCYSEATGNLSAIRTAQESYYADNGVYLECRPSPPEGGISSTPAEWIDAGGFTAVGFGPDGNVRYQYEVPVSNDGQFFTATAKGDLDDDGEQAIYTLSKGAKDYPKPIRSGDDF